MNSAFFMNGLRTSFGQSRSLLYSLIISINPRLGRYLEVLLSQLMLSKKKNYLSVCLGLTGWQCPGQGYHGSHHLFVDHKKFNSQGSLHTCYGPCTFCLGIHLAKERARPLGTLTPWLDPALSHTGCASLARPHNKRMKVPVLKALLGTP